MLDSIPKHLILCLGADRVTCYIANAISFFIVDNSSLSAPDGTRVEVYDGRSLRLSYVRNDILQLVLSGLNQGV
jgi:hypothetical protein